MVDNGEYIERGAPNGVQLNAVAILSCESEANSILFLAF